MDIVIGVSSKEHHRHQGLDELLSETVSDDCTYCGAPANEPCVNPLTGHIARVPHMLHRTAQRRGPAIACRPKRLPGFADVPQSPPALRP